MTTNRSVCVVIVTYNRKQLLMELLEDLERQTVPIDGIVLVNNASTDGTEEALTERGIISGGTAGETMVSDWNGRKVYYYLSPTNTGGSGGFARAFSIVSELPYDLVWTMDDDVSPEPDCLEQLINNLSGRTGVCIPCRTDENWTDYVITDYNLTNPFLVKLDTFKTRIDSRKITGNDTRIVDMPLEGPLFKKEVIRRIGVPNQEYFIIFDDTDYAYRASMVTEIRYIKSAVLHRKLAVMQDKPRAWNWKDYYMLRNQFYFDRQYGKNWLVRHFRPYFSSRMKILSALRQKKTNRIPWIRKAYDDAVHGRMGMVVAPGTDVGEK